jgi:hypothetical protein
MNCHTAVKAESPKLELVRESYETGKPLEWIRIHKVPDYVHFNHSRHIRAQIDCKSCHGPIEQMGVVSQYKPLSMGWCLDCHRQDSATMATSGVIVGARPISGVFTGKLHDVNDLLDSSYVFAPIAAQVGKSTPITSPQFGGYHSQIPPKLVDGVPHPKKAGIGPENCSACHY